MKNFFEWLKGKSTKEFLENLSFVILAVSVAMVAIGLGLGSFFKYTVFVASFGAFLILPAIIIYIISQLLEKS